MTYLPHGSGCCAFTSATKSNDPNRASMLLIIMMMISMMWNRGKHRDFRALYNLGLIKSSYRSRKRQVIVGKYVL